MIGRLLIMACWAWMACGLWEASGQVSREYDIKSVFLLNFAQFVEWPEEAFRGEQDPVVIGILGNDPFRSTLEEVVRGETVRHRRVIVQRFRRVEDVKACHILFVCRSEGRRLTQVLSSLKEQPILTVSEIDDFAQRGGMIGMFTENEKVRLRINPETARAARLVISSKLLRVAEVIRPPPP